MHWGHSSPLQVRLQEASSAGTWAHLGQLVPMGQAQVLDVMGLTLLFLSILCCCVRCCIPSKRESKS